MKVATIVVDNAKSAVLTVNDVSDNIDLLGYGPEEIEIDFSWTAAPIGTAMATARLEARVNQSDAAGSGPIDQVGLINLDGADGTVTATFTVDLSALVVGRGYFDVITLADADGNTKTWVGSVRTIN